jgi:hypothetical protein
LETYHILLSSITTTIFTTLEYINTKEEPQETQHVEAEAEQGPVESDLRVLALLVHKIIKQLVLKASLTMLRTWGTQVRTAGGYFHSVRILLLLSIRYTSSDVNHNHNQDIVYFQFQS